MNWPTLQGRLSQPIVTRKEALEQLERVSPEIMTGAAKQELAKFREEKHYYVYILLCADGTYYTGWTTNLEKRVVTHNKGKGAKYTRSRRPVKLVYQEEYSNKSIAMKAEYSIKQMSKSQKIIMTLVYKYRNAISKLK